MPEFRFRRKKQQNRRKTVHDLDEAARQIEAAKNLVPQQKADKRASIGGTGPEVVGVANNHVTGSKPDRSSLVQEREKFLELLRQKYPEQALNLEMMSNGGSQDAMTNGESTTDLISQPIALPEPAVLTRTASDSNLASYKDEEIEAPTTNAFSECLFLRYGKSIRQCPMPCPITLSTVKNLYRNLFDLSDDILDNPGLSFFLRERGKRDWKKLENISMVVDHCMLLLVEAGQTLSHSQSPPMDSDINTPLDGLSSQDTVNKDKNITPISQEQKRNGLWKAGRTKEIEDLTQIPDNHPVHKTVTSPLSLTSSTSGVYSEPSVDAKKFSEKSRQLKSSVAGIKAELAKIRSDNISKMEDFSLTMNQASNQITAFLKAFVRVGSFSGGSEVYRRERLELYREEEAYEHFSKQTLGELRLLETAVEEMRVDVTARRCGVAEQEVNALSQSVNATTRAVKQLQAAYDPLEAKMKRVMESELQTVVKEEKFLKEEGPRVAEAGDTCIKLGQTLEVLTQFSSVQKHRTPMVPFYPTIREPDREAVLENIQAVIPNHAHRLEALKLAEAIQKKKKDLHSPLKVKLKEFESQLRIQRDHLKHIEVSTIEKQQELKVRARFMEDRYKMEKELQKELETERKLANQKREQRKKQMEELWKWQQHAKAEDEKMRQKMSIKQVMAGASTSSGSNRSIPTSEDGNRFAPLHTRASSDDRTSQASETPPIHLTPAPKGKRFKKKPHQRKSFGYVGEFEHLYQTIKDEVDEQSTNQNAAPGSHDPKPSNLTIQSRSHDKATNQKPPSLGPRIELKDANQKPQQFQTTPPFKHPSKQHSPARNTKNIGQIKTTINKPSMPMRYIVPDHASQPESDSPASMPKNVPVQPVSLSQPVNDEHFRRSHMNPMLPIDEVQFKRPPVAQTTTRGAQNPNPIKRSNSDDSIYESSTLERRKKQGLANAPYKVKQRGDLSPSLNRKWAMNMISKEPRPFDYRQMDNRHSNQARTHNSSASSGSSSERKPTNLRSNYPHNFVQRPREAQPQRHAPNCPAHGHSVPMRQTRSSQLPSEALTAYPRHLASAAHTFQMRTASNGAVHRGRVTHYPGHVSTGPHVMSHVSHVSSGGGHGFGHVSSRGRGNNDDMGSLV